MNPIWTLASVLAGGGLSVLGGFLLERTRWRRTYVTRWDERKLDAATKYFDKMNSSVEAISDCANAMARNSDDEARIPRKRFQELRAELRTLHAEIKMIAPSISPSAEAAYESISELRTLALQRVETEEDRWKSTWQVTRDRREEFVHSVRKELEVG